MSKAKVAVVTDSTACLTPELLAKYNITTIPLVVNWDGEVLKDGVDISADQFYTRLQSSSSMPSTSQPSVGEFVEFFNGVSEGAEEIAGAFISSDLSGTFASATGAQSMVEYPVEILDSRITATSLGMIVIEMAEAVKNGATAAEAIALGKSLINKTNVIFLVDTLEFLHRGGRIGGASKMLGSMLSLKPLLTVKDGKVDSLARVRTMKKALTRLYDELQVALEGQKPRRLAVIHASAPAEAEKIKTKLIGMYPGLDVWVSDMTPVIGTHVGPGAVGIAFLKQ